MNGYRGRESLVLATTLLIQLIVAARLPLPGFRPDFLLVPLTIIALYRTSQGSVVLGFVFGLIQDCLGMGPIGFFAFSKTLICILLGLVGKRIIPENRVVQLAALIFAVLTQHVLHHGLLALLVDTPLRLDAGMILRLAVELLVLSLFHLLAYGTIVRVAWLRKGPEGVDADLELWMGPGSR
jgi:rod shape-determining protein MreD